MDKVKQEKEAKKFVGRWIDRGSEKSDTHSFWLELLENVYGVKLPGQYIEFEKRVKFKGTTKFIDAYIPQTLRKTFFFLFIENEWKGMILWKGIYG